MLAFWKLHGLKQPFAKYSSGLPEYHTTQSVILKWNAHGSSVESSLHVSVWCLAVTFEYILFSAFSFKRNRIGNGQINWDTKDSPRGNQCLGELSLSLELICYTSNDAHVFLPI